MVAKVSYGLPSFLLYTRRLICIVGAGQNADGLSRGAVLSFAGFRSGKLENTWPEIPWEGSCWFRLVCAVASWLLWRKLSAFLRLTETQIESIGKKYWRRPVMGWRPPYYCMPDDSSAFWELAKMQMEFPGTLCCHLLASGRACSLSCPYASKHLTRDTLRRLVLVQPCLRDGSLAALAQIICISTADGIADR